MVLITDAPSHGTKYNNDPCDNHPDDDLIDEIKELCKNRINLIVLDLNG